MNGQKATSLWSVRNVGSNLVELMCPRCKQSHQAEFYGPCESCRCELREMFQATARVVDVAEYVPKMNVTPNAVALKDD